MPWSQGQPKYSGPARLRGPAITELSAPACAAPGQPLPLSASGAIPAGQTSAEGSIWQWPGSLTRPSASPSAAAQRGSASRRPAPAQRAGASRRRRRGQRQMALHGRQQQRGQVGKTGQLGGFETALVRMVAEVDRQQRAVVTAVHHRQPLDHAVAAVDGLAVQRAGRLAGMHAQHRRLAGAHRVEAAVESVEALAVDAEAVPRGVGNADTG